MEYSEFILAVNAASIAILILIASLLLASTRFKGMNGYAALITVVPTVPVYLYNMSRMMEWHNLSAFILPLSSSVNTTLMPLLWLFTRGNFDPEFRWNIRKLIHFIPAAVLLILTLSMDMQARMDQITFEMTGKDSWLGNLNSGIVLLQVIGYFTAIFVYIARMRKKVSDTASDAEWLQKLWVPRFMILFFVLFMIVEVCYMIWPRTDAWLIQIINVISMTYLMWGALTHKNMPVKQIETLPKERNTDEMALDEMMAVCEKASAYLNESKAYLRPDLSLAIFAKEAGISPRTLSRSINGYLKINFFDFINRMRVEEAKRLLSNLDSTGYSVDSIFEECGFRSRSTFFLVFKKIEGISPAAWLSSFRD